LICKGFPDFYDISKSLVHITSANNIFGHHPAFDMIAGGANRKLFVA
jgi:hypothetical protein